ncbi:hypothetical protein N9045_01995 [bacterium]|nr:hypothetical protein [bacterium]
MKKFLSVLCLSVVLSGCQKSEPEDTGFIEVDPMSVSVSEKVPESLAAALEPVSAEPVLQAESTVYPETLKLKRWFTSKVLDDTGNRMRMVDAATSNVFNTDDSSITSTSGQVTMANESLLFESAALEGTEGSLKECLCQVTFPEGQEFKFKATHHNGRFFLSNKGLAITDLMRTYSETTEFCFAYDSKVYVFEVTSEGL